MFASHSSVTVVRLKQACVVKPTGVLSLIACCKCLLILLKPPRPKAFDSPWLRLMIGFISVLSIISDKRLGFASDAGRVCF
jgi:hypothetical protein